jgi:hypothetical protein
MVREKVGLVLAFYRAEEEGERAAEAVGAAVPAAAINGGGGSSVRWRFWEGKRWRRHEWAATH